MSVNHLIKRPSLGRRAALGQLYDARNENFNEKNLFNKDLNSGLLVLEEKDVIEIEANRIENQLDRFKSLKIDGEPMLSVLAGLIELAGTAKYLSGGAVNEKTLSYNIVENVLTLSEKIKWEEREILSYISEKDLEDDAVTHVVVGIEWGSSVIVSLDVDISQESDPNAVDERIWAGLQSVINLLKDGNLTDHGVVLGEGSRLQAYADDGLIVTLSTVDEALSLLQEAAKPWHGRSKKRRTPIMYELLDVRHLVKRFKIPVEISTSYKRIPKGQADRVSKLLVDAKEQFGCLVNLETLSARALDAVSHCDAQDFRDYCLACMENFGMLQREVRKLLPLARDEDEDSIEQIDQLPSAKFNEWATAKGVESFERRFNSIIRAIDFFNNIAHDEMIFVKTRENYMSLKNSCSRRFFALFYTLENIEDRQHWSANVEQFKRLIASKEAQDIYVAVNIDELPQLHLQENLPAGMRIVMALEEKYYHTDLCAHIELIAQTNYVRTTATVQPCMEQSLDRVSASIPCPNVDCCEESNEGRTWICQACNKQLEYGFDRNFYCGCGKGDVVDYQFRCSSGHHGNNFLAYDPARLRAALAVLKPYEKINILVIGQTGIGKSTWINATATYITHETLEEAAASEFSYLIPFQFTTTTVTKTGNEVREIKIGASKNEIYKEKMSVTQYPKAHYFKNHDQKRVYCIVDTPGVGDCQGITRDKENMQNIVNFIGKLGQINLICFLLPPNEARLDPIFEFCFKELIMQFHRSAIHNIVFCFTKASGCGFKVSETIVPIRQLVKEIKEKQGIEIALNESSLFVFDNIAYRYLAELHKTGIPEKDQALLDLNARSYEVSAKETRKMLEQALRTPAHRVEDTLHLNYSRRIITNLAPSITMIGTKVNQTINELKDVQTKALGLSGSTTEMLKVLKKKVTFYRFKMSLTKAMICRKCAEYTEYRGAEREKYIQADPSLASKDPVVVITGGHCIMVGDQWECKKCGPNCEKIVSGKCFSKVYEDREEIDQQVQSKLNQAKNDYEKCQILIKEKEKMKQELDLEIKAIQNASAKFAIFLKENSITAYNDITEKYLQQLMDLEEKNGHIRGEKYLALSSMLADHKEEIEIIKQKLIQANQAGIKGTIKGSITAEEVLRTAEELKKLKYYGNDIYQVLESVKQWVAVDGDQEPPSVYCPPPRRPAVHQHSNYFSKRIFNNTIYKKIFAE